MQNTHPHTHKCSMSADCAYRDTQQCPDKWFKQALEKL